MKKLYFFLLLTLFTIMGCNSVRNNIFTAKVIIYTPSQDNKYLVASDIDITYGNSLEEALVSKVISTLKENGYINKNIKIKSIKRDNETINIKINNNLGDMKNNNNLALYSVVNTLTELPKTSKITIKTNRGVYVYTRNRNLLNRNKNLSPSEVLKKQMTFEQQGDFLSAYLLMSDDSSNENRKSYDEYYREMFEVYQLGFTNQKFKILDYKIDGNIARVNVVFFTPEGEVNLKFKCVKIENTWLVDWLTAQESI